MNNIIINGTITTVGPLSISMPEVAAPNTGGFPMMARGVDQDGNKHQTGYLPGTTVRGFLRRAVVIGSMQKASEAGEPYSLQRAYSELIGQDSASEKQAGEIDLAEVKKAREDSPIIDLFGSGLGVASRLRVGHFVPIKNVVPDFYQGVRKDLGDTEGVVELLSDEDAQDYYGRSESNRRRVAAEALMKDLKRKVRAAEKKNEDADKLEGELEEAEKLHAKYVTDMGDMQNSSRTIGIGYHALPASLELSGRIVILNAKDRDLEMLEYALDQLSLNPVLGAQSARGCGEISGTFDVRSGKKLLKKITIGEYESAKVTIF